MIILELANRIVKETVIRRLQAEKEVHVDMKCADFDGVMIHVFTSPGNKSELLVSIGFYSANDILRLGGEAKMREIYGPNSVTETEPGFNLTLTFNLDALPCSAEEFAERISLIKTNLFCAPLYHGIKASVGTEIDIPYRNADERLYLKKDANDRVTVVFSIAFKDPDDVVIGTVFLKEFKKSVGGAPSVDFTNGEPPLEVRGKNYP